MNKHILRLAKKSGLIKYESDGKMEETEKFAELIIRECIDLISPYTLRVSTNTSKGVEMYDAGTQLNPIYVIEQHFGMQTTSKVERLEKENQELRNVIRYLQYVQLMVGDKG
jgi:hypothetical protein